MENNEKIVGNLIPFNSVEFHPIFIIEVFRKVKLNKFINLN